MRDFIRLTKIVMDTLEQLSDEQINDILTKQAKLKIEYPKKARAAEAPAQDISEYVRNIDLFQTREEAKIYLNGLKASKKTLNDIAKHYSVPVRSKDTNAKIIDSTVEVVIGSKLRFDALLSTDLIN